MRIAALGQQVILAARMLTSGASLTGVVNLKAAPEVDKTKSV